MSHAVNIILIADQTIFLLGHEINIHDLASVTLDDDGNIVEFRCHGEEPVCKASRIDSASNLTTDQMVMWYVFRKIV